jgi:4-amino-4-deoxy-L-arabinose transferase-like glycosyltransferase
MRGCTGARIRPRAAHPACVGVRVHSDRVAASPVKSNPVYSFLARDRAAIVRRSAMRRHPVAAGACVVGAVAAVVLLFNLGGYPLWDPDEARHAEVAREVFTAPTWRGYVLPSLNFQPYLDKPILFYWLVSAVYAAGGVGEWQARLVPALAACGTVAATFVWAARVWNAAAAAATGLVLLTALEFVGLGRYVDLDMTVTLWVTLGVLAVHRWSVRAAAGERATLAPAAAAAALGMLTKGLLGPGLVGLVGFVYLIATRQLGLLRRAPLGAALAVFCAVAGPWYLVAGVLDPGYLRTFFVHHHLDRFLGGARHLHVKPAWFYVPVVFGGFFPWSLFLPATLHAALARERRDGAAVLAACWASTVFVFLTLSRGKLGTYILPAFPPLALLTGRWLGGFVVSGPRGPLERKLVVAAMWAAVAFCVGMTPALQYVAAHFQQGAWVPTARLGWVLLPGGVVLAALLARGALRWTPVVLAGAMLVGIVTFYGWAAPDIGTEYSEAALAAAIAEGPPEAATAPVVHYSVMTPSLLFYLRRPVGDAPHPRALARLLGQHPLVFVVTSPRHVDEILTAGPLVPWVTGLHHVLYASQPPPPEVAARLRARGRDEVRARARQ